MSPQCHMPSSTCHFKFLTCQLTCGFVLHKSHYMSNSTLCVCQLTFIFWCVCASFFCVKCQKLAKTLSKLHFVGKQAYHMETHPYPMIGENQ